MSEQSPKTRRPAGGVSVALGDKAEEMRTALSARRDAETLLAEASALRRSAAADADTMVAEAQALARQLVDEARHTAERLTAEAREEAAQLRREALADHGATLEDPRGRSQLRLADAEAALRNLAPTLEGAVSTVREVVGSLAELHAPSGAPGPAGASEPAAAPAGTTEKPAAAGTAEKPAAAGATEKPDTLPAVVPAAGLEQPSPGRSGVPVAEAEPGAAARLVAVTGHEPTAVERASSDRGASDGARPLGWLFRGSHTHN